MKELPKRFPEYSIMYKTLKKQIKELEKQQTSNPKESKENKSKIQQYVKEVERIKGMFPENYFDE